MSVPRLLGVFAIVGLVALPVGMASPPILGDSGLFEPQPTHTLTLPGPVSAGSYVYYDDFSWCEAPPCEVSDGPHISTRLNGATGSLSVPADTWEVREGGLEGTAAFTYTDPGWSFGVPEFKLVVRPHVPFASIGSNIQVTLVATPTTSLMVQEGGLRLQMTVWDDHMEPISGPHDCLLVPGSPVGEGFHELVPANPLCKAVPMTTKIEMVFTVEEGLLGTTPDVAIDSILVDRI